MGDGSDLWAPPGSDAESGATLSAAAATKEGARGLLAALSGPDAGAGPLRERKGGRER